MHGVKLYLNQNGLHERYSSYDMLTDELVTAGVNTVFTTVYEGRTAFYDTRTFPNRDRRIDMRQLRERLQSRDIRCGAICQIFYDADTLAARPDLVPIDQHGDGTFVNWQKLVCPSDREYRDYKLSIVKEVATTVRPDVVSLDFMRFPTTWEIIPPEAKTQEIRNFCFCDRCLTGFQKDSGVAIPADRKKTPEKAQWILANHNTAWVKWKTGLITSFVAEASRSVRGVDPSIKVSVHVVPWAESVFENALVWNAAQDVAALAAHVDYLSPMIYHKLIGRPADYVRTLTAELAGKTNKTMLPSIQVAKILTEDEVSADEFRQTLTAALAPPSGGTLLFQWEELRPDRTAPDLRRRKQQIFRAATP